MKSIKYAFSLALVFLFFSCDDIIVPIGDDVSFVETSDEIPKVIVDESRKIAVYYDGRDNLIDLEAYDENSEKIVRCVEVADFIAISDDSFHRSSGNLNGNLKAVIIGYRSDNRPGIWMVFSDNSVQSPRNEATGKMAPLLDVLSSEDVVSEFHEYNGFLGWTYVPRILSDNGLMIGGYAIHEAGKYAGPFVIEKGAKAAVFWNIYYKNDSYYISRAHVVGIAEEKNNPENRHRRWIAKMVDKFKLLFLSHLEDYLVEPESLSYSESEDLYIMKGSNSVLKAAEALIEGSNVISIDVLDIVENTPPVVSFATWDYEVRGAEIDAVNQNYTASGTSFNRTMYTGDGNPSYVLFGFWAPGGAWGIHTTQTEIITPNQLTYYTMNSNQAPPDSGWINSADGSQSSLKVYKVPIHGDVVTFGSELRGFYQYADFDGDEEGESLFQWYRCETPGDEGVPIPGADKQTYTTVSDDYLKYLKLEVTPVDSRGLAGSPVKSKASDQIGST